MQWWGERSWIVNIYLRSGGRCSWEARGLCETASHASQLSDIVNTCDVPHLEMGTDSFAFSGVAFLHALSLRAC